MKQDDLLQMQSIDEEGEKPFPFFWQLSVECFQYAHDKHCPGHRDLPHVNA